MESQSLWARSYSGYAEDDSEFSDEESMDSAVLFAEDNEEEMSLARKKTDEGSKSHHTISRLAEKQTIQSTRHIYGVVAFLVAGALLVGSIVYHMATKSGDDEFKAAVSSENCAVLETYPCSARPHVIITNSSTARPRTSQTSQWSESRDFQA